MANVKYDYNKTKNTAYREGAGVENARSNMNSLAAKYPQYANSYAGQIEGIYNQMKNGNTFSYNPQNDAAYRRYAEEYNALSGLAVAGNQAQAQTLTGGYGSTYAPEVASQGLARMQAGVVNAQPAFLQGAQQAYMAQQDQFVNAYNAAANAREAELADYKNAVSAYNDRMNLAQQRYRNERDFGYNAYKDNRDYYADRYDKSLKQQQFDTVLAQNEREFNAEYELKSYDVYNKLASTKCADYNEAGDNAGMKAYLDGLVSAGKITQYMADNLYKQYKYEAPLSGGGGGSGRRSSGGSSGSRGYSDYTGTGGNGVSGASNDKAGFDKFVAAHPKELQSVDKYHYNTILVKEIKSAQSKGDISANDAADLLNYYGLTGDEYKSQGSGDSHGTVSANKRTQMRM